MIIVWMRNMEQSKEKFRRWKELKILIGCEDDEEEGFYNDFHVYDLRSWMNGQEHTREKRYRVGNRELDMLQWRSPKKIISRQLNIWNWRGDRNFFVNNQRHQ